MPPALKGDVTQFFSLSAAPVRTGLPFSVIFHAGQVLWGLYFVVILCKFQARVFPCLPERIVVFCC